MEQNQCISRNSFPTTALFDDGAIRPCGSKSKLMKLLINKYTDSVTTANNIEPTVVIFDGAYFTHMLAPKSSMTFYEYATDVFVKKIISDAGRAERIDVVFDQYFEMSIKAQKRHPNGPEGREENIDRMSMIPTDWENFLSHEINKRKLFPLLAEIIVDTVKHKRVYVTSGCDVLSNGSDIDSILKPCSQEEADGRMYLHALSASNEGHDVIMIRSSDTDVVVIGIAVFFSLNLQKLWVAFKSGQQFKQIPVHEIAVNLGPKKARALPFFHAFTGCDSVSSFSGVGKERAWKAWEQNQTLLTPVFEELSWKPKRVTDDQRDALTTFTIALYRNSHSEDLGLDEARRILQSRKKGNLPIELIPPTPCHLRQHINRAVFQAGLLWGNCLNKDAKTSPLLWGWQLDDTGKQYKPLWCECNAI